MKYIYVLLAVFMFSGCNARERISIELSCIEGLIYVDVYKATISNPKEDIKKPQYLLRDKTLYLDDDKNPIRCINKDNK